MHESKTYGGQGRGFGRSSQQTFGRQNNLNDKCAVSLIEEEASTQREKTPSKDSEMIQQSRYPLQTWRSNEEQQADASLLPLPLFIGTGHSPVRSRPSQQTQKSKGREQTDASALSGSSVIGRGDILVRARPFRQIQRSKERDQTDASAIPESCVMSAGHSLSKSRQTQRSQERQQVESTNIQGSSSMDVRQPRATRKLARNKLTSNDVTRTDSSPRKTSSSTNTSNVADIEQTILSTRKRVQKSAANETLVFESTVLCGETTSYLRILFRSEPPQSDDVVFKLPHTPKLKALRSSSNKKWSGKIVLTYHLADPLNM